MAEKIQSGFEAGHAPKLTDEGTSGTYLMKDDMNSALAVFKPFDEEQFAPNNPRNYQGDFGSNTLRPGVLSGESTVRELAAYLIDRDGFSGVPETSLALISHESFD